MLVGIAQALSGASAGAQENPYYPRSDAREQAVGTGETGTNRIAEGISVVALLESVFDTKGDMDSAHVDLPIHRSGIRPHS